MREARCAPVPMVPRQSSGEGEEEDGAQQQIRAFASGTFPLVSVAGGIVVLGEHPARAQFLGVGLVVGLVSHRDGRRRALLGESKTANATAPQQQKQQL